MKEDSETREIRMGPKTKFEAIKRPPKQFERYGERKRERGVLLQKEKRGEMKYLFFFTENGTVRSLLSNGFKVFFEQISLGESCILTFRSIRGGDWNLLISIERERCDSTWTKEPWKIALFRWICQIQEAQRGVDKQAFQLFKTIVRSQKEHRLRTFVKTIFFILKKSGFKFIFDRCGGCEKFDIQLFWALEIGGLICDSCRKERAPDTYPFLCSKQEQNDLEFIQKNDLESIYAKMSERRIRSRMILFLVTFVNQNCGFHYNPTINSEVYFGTDGSTI